MKGSRKQRVSKIVSVPAPVGGLDEISPLANTDPNYAVILENFFPGYGDLEVRKGYLEWTTNLPSTGKTLMHYLPASGSPYLFCCTDDGIYDVTLTTDTPVLAHALTEGNVKWTQFTNTGGTYLIGCNGVDPAFFFDGTSWTDFTDVVTPTVPGEISGLAPEQISDVVVHKNRLWFIRTGTLDSYYLPVDAITGAVTPFYLGGVLSHGGYLSSLITWTQSSGKGIDDILIFQSSQGEIAGYSGTDPDDATTWALESVYFIGPPLGNKTHVELTGDILMLTSYGVVPISSIVGGQYTLGDDKAIVSRRISKSLNEIVRQRSSNPGWEIMASPLFQYMVITIPSASGVPAKQYVMNSVTGAWANFDLPAVTMLEFGDGIFFTDENNRVLKYGTVEIDEVMLDGSGGEPIVAFVAQAFNYFGAPGVDKHYKMIRPVVESIFQPVLSYRVVTDFNRGVLTDLAAPVATAVNTMTAWDSAVWDQDSWLDYPSVRQKWFGVVGIGYSASLALKLTKTDITRYVSCDWAFEPGSSL